MKVTTPGPAGNEEGREYGAGGELAKDDDLQEVLTGYPQPAVRTGPFCCAQELKERVGQERAKAQTQHTKLSISSPDDSQREDREGRGREWSLGGHHRGGACEVRSHKTPGSPSLPLPAAKAKQAGQRSLGHLLCIASPGT